MHDRSIVFPGEDVTGPAHVCSELVDLVSTLDDTTRKSGIAKIAEAKVIRRTCGEFVVFDVSCPHPIAFGLETLHKVAANESAAAANKSCFHMSSFLLALLQRPFLDCQTFCSRSISGSSI